MNKDTLLAAQAGDEKAFEEIVREATPIMKAVAYKMMGNHEDADDVVQDASLNLWRFLKSFQGNSTLTTWAYRVAANASIDRLRKKARITRHETCTGEDYSIGELDDPENVAIGMEELSAAIDKVRALPEELQAPYVLKHLLGHSVKEIAAIEGSSVPTIKSRLARAQAAL